MGKTFRISCSGFGGQGVMALGKLLVYAGMDEGKEVSWVPSYGPEMRGGTANCSVIISDEPIASPVVDSNIGVNVVMNLPSFQKFVPKTAKGGVVIGIVEENKIPVKFIGVGEQIDDMEVFNSEDFVKAII